jgi:hypothetical protein
MPDMPVSVVPKRERVSVARPGVTRARLGRRGRRRRRLPAQTHSAPEGRPARADGRRDAVITLLKRPGAAPIPSVFRAFRSPASGGRGGGKPRATTWSSTAHSRPPHARERTRPRPPSVSRGSAYQKHGRRTPRTLQRSEPSSLAVTARRARFISARLRAGARVRDATKNTPVQ